MHTSGTSPQPRLRLTEARNKRGLSQQELADKIGTNYVNVSRWERGITKPSPYFRRKLCTYFGRTEEELDLLPAADTGEQAALSAASAVAASVTSEREMVGSGPIYDPTIPLEPAIRLVGRERELEQIKQRLCSGGSVALTALNGLPGVGKTALSITLAHAPEVREYFDGGVLWAGLGPHPNTSSLLSRWGVLLGILDSQMASLGDDEARSRAIRTAIGARRMLLVIDDAWKLEEALTFKVGGPNCAHLVTTRFPTIASHMALGGATILQELGEEESITLLRMLAPQVVNREVQRVHDLVHAVGGLPLALTLIGNYLRKQAYSGPARRITAALERLSDAEVRLHISEPHVPVESHPSLPIETQLSLQSVIAVTDQLLSVSTQATLYALSAFPPKPNTFSEEAALAVAGCTLDELDSLIDFGLLESNGADRYSLHQVIADYAALHLKGQAMQAAYERLIAYVNLFVQGHAKEYELLELESNTILAALDKAYELGMEPELVQMVCSFAPFLLLRGLYPLAEQHLLQAREAAVKLADNYGLTGTLLYLGEVAQKQGNYGQAEEHFQKGLALAREAGDHERICALLTGLGDVKQRQGDYAQAEVYLQEGLGLAREIGDQEQICALLQGLGSVTLRRGEFSQAEAYLQEGLALARQIGSPERICSFLRVLGPLENQKGDYVQAEIYLQEGLPLARQIGDREQICVMLMNIGVSVGGRGMHKQAEIFFLEGLMVARQIGHREWMGALLANLGQAAREQGNYFLAETYFREGLEVVRQIGNREWTSILLENLGEVAYEQEHFDKAEKCFQESLTLARQIGNAFIVSEVLYKYGNLHLKQDQIEAAKRAFDEMIASIPEGGRELAAMGRYGLARVEASIGHFDEVQRIGRAALADLESMSSRMATEVRDWLNALPH